MLARKITLAQDLDRIRGDLGLTVGRSDGRTRRVRTATAEEVPYGRRRLRASSPSTTRARGRGGFLCGHGGEGSGGGQGGCKRDLMNKSPSDRPTGHRQKI